MDLQCDALGQEGKLIICTVILDGAAALCSGRLSAVPAGRIFSLEHSKKRTKVKRLQNLLSHRSLFLMKIPSISFMPPYLDRNNCKPTTKRRQDFGEKTRSH
jgi:hypothetical protein